MTTNEIITYNSNLISRIFRIFYVLERFPVNEIFTMIYESEFYQNLIWFPDDMYGYADYWAYYQISLENGIQPKNPVEQYKSGFNLEKLHNLTRLFETLRIKTELSPGTVCACFRNCKTFSEMLEGKQNTESASKILIEDLNKYKNMH